MSGVRTVAHVERGGRLGDARGEQLGAVPLARAARGLGDQPLDLLLADAHVLEVLAREQHLRAQRLCQLLAVVRDGAGRVLRPRCAARLTKSGGGAACAAS